MTTYIISFEINDSYRRNLLKNKIREVFKTYCPLHEHSWAVGSLLKAVEIRDLLTPILKSNDRLFVFKSGLEGAWINSYGVEHNRWLKDNL